MDSIMTQTFQDFEVIILDDCSTDNSKSVIESYRNHPKVSTIFYNEVNSGSPFIQWNKGISLARGSLVWIADSDDFAQSNFLEETVSKMNAFPTVGLVYTQCLEKDEISGAEYPIFQDPPRFKQSYNKSYFENGRKELREKFVHEDTIPCASGVLFRKSVFEWVGGADHSMVYCGDWFLWIKILLVSDAYFIAEPLNTFRLTHISVRSRFSKVQAFHERMRILYFLRWRKLRHVDEKELILLKNLFNSFMLSKLDKPVNIIWADPVIKNKLLKVVPAFLLSVIDRVNHLISNLRNRRIIPLNPYAH